MAVPTHIPQVTWPCLILEGSERAPGEDEDAVGLADRGGQPAFSTNDAVCRGVGEGVGKEKPFYQCGRFYIVDMD